jgi:hypothetical protein
MRRHATRNLGALLLCGLLFPAAVAAAEGAGGVAVAPLVAMGVEPSTAAILTGVAEGTAMELASGGRFVAHGELLRAVDAGGESGCRSEDCLARAAAGLGADRLLTGEVGLLGETYLVKVQLATCPEAETLATVSRQCVECDESGLPVLLQDALLGLVRGPESGASAQVSDDGRTIVLVEQLSEGAFHYKDLHRTLSRESLEIDGVELSSLTAPGEAIGCVQPGGTAAIGSTLLVHNGGEAATRLRGPFRVEVYGDEDDEPLAVLVEPVDVALGAGGSEDGTDSAAVSIAVSFEVPADAGPLRVRTLWDGELLEEQLTRPPGAVVVLGEVLLLAGERQVSELSWGEPMQVAVVLDKTRAGAAAEVTIRLERKIRYWFDSEARQATYEIPAGEDGEYRLVLPFTPAAADRASTEGYGVEVWVNGCMLHRMGLVR